VYTLSGWFPLKEYRLRSYHHSPPELPTLMPPKKRGQDGKPKAVEQILVSRAYGR
jgi:hypothetical protein